MIHARSLYPVLNSVAHWLQYVRVHVGPYQALRTRPATVRSNSPFWNEDLMFVAAEPFDDILHLIVEDRMGPKVSVPNSYHPDSPPLRILIHLRDPVLCHRVGLSLRQAMIFR